VVVALAQQHLESVEQVVVVMDLILLDLAEKLEPQTLVAAVAVVVQMEQGQGVQEL
jgi:hypothetical protein